MMSTSTVGMRKAFTLSRITLTLCQSHRLVRTKHSCLYSAFHSAGVTYTPTYTAVTSVQYARLLSKSFSSGFPPENDHPLQPAKPEKITTTNIDDVGPTLTVDVNVPVEQLYGKIRHLHSDVVLEMLQTSYKQLDKIALAISLRRLHQVMMILPDEAREGYIEHVRTSAGFQIMCALLARNAQHLNAEVVFDMTKFLADFGLDSDHPAQLINLQLCHYHINDLAIDQLVQLATTLSKMIPTDQTKTLFDGIGVLCAARETEVTILSVEEKIYLLKFYGDRFGEQYQLQVLDAVKHELVDVNWKLAVPLLQALEHLQLCDWTIMSTCIDAISGGVDWLSRGDVFATLDTCFAHKLYSPDLLLAFGHKSVMEYYNISEKVALLGKFRQQSFVHVSLIEDVVEFVASNTEVLDTLDGGLLLELLQCIAEAYIWVPGVPHVSEVLCQKVTDSCRLLEPTALLHVCLSLTTLKQPISSDLVKQLFHPDNMEKLLATDAPHCSGPVDAHHITVAEKLFLVASATEASDLSEQCLRLIEEDDTRRRQSERSLPLKQAIEVSLEDDPCITEHNMTSNTGLHIDHLVRRETTPKGSPVAAGDKQELVPEKPVAVLVFDGGCFQRNTGQLKGSTHLYVRTLKREGYIMAVINWNSFQKVEERDRLRYLQHKILFASDYQDLHMMGIDNIGHTE